MKFKSFLRRTTATVLAAGGAFTGTIAYAGNDKNFNPIYSGRLSYSSGMYMEITDSNAILRCVWYPITDTQSKLISIDDPETLWYDLVRLAITYNHKGTIMTTDGTTYGKTPEPVNIVTGDTRFSYGWFNKITGAEVDYNGITYKS